ncbi:PIN domain-containing protein [Pelomonas sp. KK5]|uniref:PIN domain-containing protein n=1 Tax=Pelomonas sp. KK5 TaxID=1855730 RepID=UPI00097C950B|nr:type II toxin-antitoxin system VapC family toxin [Pelomonas sp. KK5]
MAALDTNVLVRYLVRDDPMQTKATRRLFDQELAAGRALFVPVTVLLELEWVLRSTFGFDKEAVVNTFVELLMSSELAFDSEWVLEAAVWQYRKSSADFADCLHAALAQQAGESPLWTFDKGASKLPSAQLLGA